MTVAGAVPEPDALAALFAFIFEAGAVCGLDGCVAVTAAAAIAGADAVSAAEASDAAAMSATAPTATSDREALTRSLQRGIEIMMSAYAQQYRASNVLIERQPNQFPGGSPEARP
jgi:hypothetical protein